MIRLDWLWVHFCWMFVFCFSFFEGAVGAMRLRSIEMLLWNLWQLEQISPWILKENSTKGAPGDAKIGPRGYPPENPKNRSQQNAQQVYSIGQMAVPEREFFKIGSQYHRIKWSSSRGAIISQDRRIIGSSYPVPLGYRIVEPQDHRIQWSSSLGL